MLVAHNMYEQQCRSGSSGDLNTLERQVTGPLMSQEVLAHSRMPTDMLQEGTGAIVAHGRPGTGVGEWGLDSKWGA